MSTTISRRRWSAVPWIRRAISQIWPRVAIVVGVVAVWWAIAASGYFSPVLLPTPPEAWRSLLDHLWGPDGLVVAAQRSLVRLAFGMGVAVVIGTPIGLAMAAWRPVQRSVGTLMIGL